MTNRSDLARRDAVLDEVRSLLDKLNRTQQVPGLPPIEASAAATDMQRLEQVEALLRTVRAGLLETGEVSSTLLVALIAQSVAWCAAQDERSECKVVPA